MLLVVLSPMSREVVSSREEYLWAGQVSSSRTAMHEKNVARSAFELSVKREGIVSAKVLASDEGVSLQD